MVKEQGTLNSVVLVAHAFNSHVLKLRATKFEGDDADDRRVGVARCKQFLRDSACIVYSASLILLYMSDWINTGGGKTLGIIWYCRVAGPEMLLPP